MRYIPDFLSKSFSFSLKGDEKYCLLSKKPVNGYLQVGNIIPLMSDVTRYFINRDLSILTPASFSLYRFTNKVTLEELFCSTKDYATLTQEQITAVVSSFETYVLPRDVNMCGTYQSVFFFEERRTVWVCLFKTSSEGNECEIHEMTELVKETVVGRSSKDRLIVRDRILL